MLDERTYNYAVSLRAITSVDGMTVDFYMFTNNQFKEISLHIINNVKGINEFSIIILQNHQKQLSGISI